LILNRYGLILILKMMALRGLLAPVWGRLSSLPVFAFCLALA